MNPNVYYTQLISAVQSLAEATRAQLGTLERISLTLDRIEQKGISIGKPPTAYSPNPVTVPLGSVEHVNTDPDRITYPPGVPPPVPPHRPQAPRSPATKRTLR